MSRLSAHVRGDEGRARPDAVRRLLDRRAGGLRAVVPPAGAAARPQGVLLAPADPATNPAVAGVGPHARPTTDIVQLRSLLPMS